jgi:hypothetical protein
VDVHGQEVAGDCIATREAEATAANRARHRKTIGIRGFIETLLFGQE